MLDFGGVSFVQYILRLLEGHVFCAFCRLCILRTDFEDRDVKQKLIWDLKKLSSWVPFFFSFQVLFLKKRKNAANLDAGSGQGLQGHPKVDSYPSWNEHSNSKSTSKHHISETFAVSFKECTGLKWRFLPNLGNSAIFFCCCLDGIDQPILVGGKTLCTLSCHGTLHIVYTQTWVKHLTTGWCEAACSFNRMFSYQLGTNSFVQNTPLKTKECPLKNRKITVIFLLKWSLFWRHVHFGGVCFHRPHVSSTCFA